MVRTRRSLKKRKYDAIKYDCPEERTATKITDINQLCLEHIFTHLDLNDLLNVADKNKYLKQATYIAFTRKYGGKSVHLRIDRWKHLKDLNDIVLKYKVLMRDYFEYSCF